MVCRLPNMKVLTSKVLFAVVVSSIGLLSSIHAIKNGFPDGDGKDALYPAVGAIVFTDGEPAIPDCTGTLIAPDKFVTAAHCVDLDPVDGTSLFGRQSFSLEASPIDKRGGCKGCIEIKEIFFHPRWDPVVNFAAADTGDLAICKLKRSIKHVEPIAFGSLGDYDDGDAPPPGDKELFTVVGYGASEDPDGNPADFEFLDIRIITEDNQFQNINSVYLQTQQAAGGSLGGTCFGDSVSDAGNGPTTTMLYQSNFIHSFIPFLDRVVVFCVRKMMAPRLLLRLCRKVTEAVLQ